MIDYLISKFPHDLSMAYEWSYNLDNACQRYTHDEKLQVFYEVLCGHLDEQLYYIQMQYILSLLRFLTRIRESMQPPDAEAMGVEARFTDDEFKQSLHQYFEGKLNDDQLEKLLSAAHLELDEPKEPEMEQGEEGTEGGIEGGIEFMKLFFEVSKISRPLL